MKKEFLEKLLAKYIADKISDTEKKILDNWYDSFEMDEGYTNELTGSEKDELEKRLLIKIDQGIDSFEEPNTNQKRTIAHFSSKYKTPTFFPYRYSIAAVFIGIILLVGLVYIILHNNKVIHSTAYGQILYVTLPDSSMVILNGNSSLTYRDSWSNNGPREVFLEGEAFFSVKHKEEDQKFLVNTADHFSVEVLGTEFNVKKRKNGSRVVLNSGKVRLNFKQPSGTEQVIMKPGELVDFKNNTGDYLKKEVNAEIYSSWKDGKLMLDHTSLREILIMLEESYGLNVKGADKELLDQEISGSMPAENIDTLLKNISVTYGIKIYRKKGGIEIRK